MSSDGTDTAPLPPKFRWRRRVAWIIGGLIALLLVLLIAAGSGVWWTLRSESGAAWALSRLPGFKVTGGKGTLWGDYAAERVEFSLANGTRVLLDDVAWKGLHVRQAPWATYRAGVVMSELRARRLEVIPAAVSKKEPLKPPTHLRFPIELDIGAFRVGEFHTRALGDKPLRDVSARLHFGDERGEVHVIDGLSLSWGRLQASGTARIATTSPFAMDVKLDVAQNVPQDATAWQARTRLTGPLATPSLAAQVQARPAGGRPAQSLDLRAGLRPFDAWPLGELQATTQSLDLSAFHSAAPATAISGSASATTRGLDSPASVTARFANADAGRWNDARLPVRELAFELRARPSDPRTLDLRDVDARLGTRQQAAGRLRGEGQWTPDAWRVDATLDSVQPSQLDARAAPMTLSGPVSVRATGTAQGHANAQFQLKTQLAGEFKARGPARSAQLALDATASSRRIDLRGLQLRMGAARASLKGAGVRESAQATWRAKGELRLLDFDPSPWWPGADDSPLRRGPNRLNAQADFDLAIAPAGAGATLADRLAALQGRATASIGNSVLAGVPLEGAAALRSGDRGLASITAHLDAAGNRVEASGRMSTGGTGTADHWDIRLAAPALNRLSPLWRLGSVPAGEETLSGRLDAQAVVDGRWPHIATRGELDASALRIGKTTVQGGQAKWQLDTTRDAVVDLQAGIQRLSFSQALFKGTPPVESAQLQLKGTMRSHSLELRAETRALPPAWTDALQVRRPGEHVAIAGNSTVATLLAQGGAIHSPVSRANPGRWTGWRGSVQLLELRNSNPSLPALARTRNVEADVNWGAGPLAVTVQPGRATLLGAALRWSRIAWQAGAAGRPSHIEAKAELDPVPIASFLARAQPDFGWGGDLTVVGRLDIKSAPVFAADIVLERQGGDLTVTDEAGNTQALGLTDLRLGLNAQNGVWSFTQGLAGKTLGVAAGAVVAHTSPQATWPSPDSPIQGVLEIQVANLGTWGPWVPAGWRLTGALRTSAGIGGRFGAPEYTGRMQGSGIGVRNFLQGVNVTDGEVAIALQGATARIERFTARAGQGTVKLEGDATLGASPKAVLRLAAEKFQLLGRVDRRIVTTGQAQMQLDRENLQLDGQFAVDEGLFDFSRSDAPRLSDDVQVVRAKDADAPEPARNGNAAPGRKVNLDLRVDLGKQLKLRGRGIDTSLQGELRVTSPNNRLAINGTVRAMDGTYAAYGQKLTIERGLITFIGPVENPRLDIEATRPNLDVRVGVQVSGTALNPRVRLFSEPEMSEMDKLSWLVLGRASEGLGRTDTALLQRAALALLAGEGEGMGDQFTKAIGLDEVSLRQTEGEVRETVISLGKQLSRRWYVGYERSLTATTGTWQLIYRIAQRFTLRAQTGADSSLDVIWTWRWQ